jgi:hypothetical protein
MCNKSLEKDKKKKEKRVETLQTSVAQCSAAQQRLYCYL